MTSIINVILNCATSTEESPLGGFQDLTHQKRRCRNKFGMTKTMGGFTLIELMIALSIMAVLGTVGIAGFRNYSQIQVLQSSVNEFTTALNTARSRALSQVKPAICASNSTLDGYGVKVLANPITPPKYSYRIFVRCSESDKANDSIGKEIILSKNISFADADNNKIFFFPTLTGGVSTPEQVTISGYGKGKIVSVNSLGGVGLALLPTPTPTLIPTPTSTPTPTPVTCGSGYSIGQTFGTGNMKSCSGALITFANASLACGPGSHVCSITEYVARSNGIGSNYDVWLSTQLQDSTMSCPSSLCGGSSCTAFISGTDIGSWASNQGNYAYVNSSCSEVNASNVGQFYFSSTFASTFGGAMCCN